MSLNWVHTHKTIPDREFHLLFFLSPVCLLPYSFMLLLQIHDLLGLTSSRIFFQLSAGKCWYVQAHTKCLTLFTLLKSSLDITRPLRPLSLLLAVYLLIRVSDSLFSKCFIRDEAVFLSLSKQSLMYWSSDDVVAFGLPDRALDTTDPLSSKCFRAPRAAV